MRLHLRAVRLLPLLLPILLLPMGEAFGQTCTPAPVSEGLFPSPDTEIREIAAVGSKLLLAVKDGSNGFGVWAFEEGQPLRPLLPVGGSPSWPPPAQVRNFGKFTVLNGQVFFVVEDEFNSYLWVTDPGHTRYSLVGGGPFFDYVFANGAFTVLGDWMYFRGKQGSDASTLWRSDGTRLESIKDIGGADVIEPMDLEAVGNRLFFSATTGQERELWMFAEAEGRARLFQDIWADGNSSPASLTAVGSALYFTATAGASEDMSLWRVEENALEAELVADHNTLGASHDPLMDLTAVGDKLFFHMDRPTETGDELWVSKGTADSTEALEIQGGTSTSSPRQLTAVGRMLFFIANDGTNGPEPWRSDGTAAGTSIVRNFYDTSNTPPLDAGLRAGAGVLLLSVYGNTSGKQLWSVSDTDIVQLTNISSSVDGAVPHDMTVLGNKLYFAARISAQDEELFSLPLNQVDCHAPSVTCPGPLQIEAVSSEGAYVFLPPPVQMSDDSFTPLTVSYSPGLFSLFGVDNTMPATITVTDMAGNPATCPVTVNVQDTRGPELVCPADLTVEAMGLDGADVSFPVEARDAVSGVQSVSAAPQSGGRFPLGETPVRITAVDRKGNATTPCVFNVTVKDTQPPKLICPRDIVRVATSAEPISLAYAPLELSDASPPVNVTAEPASPHSFGVGDTMVKFTATDSGSRVSECTFRVHIVDPVAPTITCPGPQQAVATGPEGAAVEFPEASAEDAVGPLTLGYSSEPGSTFPVGETTVTATATDGDGNEARCSFTVTVTGSGQQVPPTGCACRAGSASASVYWLLLALAPLWARRRIGRLAR